MKGTASDYNSETKYGLKIALESDATNLMAQYNRLNRDHFPRLLPWSIPFVRDTMSTYQVCLLSASET